MTAASVQTAYAKDPRVQVTENGYFIATVNGRQMYVLDSETFAWGIFEGPNLDMVLAPDHNLLIGFADPDQALAAILGEPQS